MSLETIKHVYQSNTFVLLKNRRQKHDLLRHLQKQYQPQYHERVFPESILKELIQRQTFVAPIYENAMNLLVYITLIHNVPVSFAVPQYASQQLPFNQQKSKYEPFVWLLPISIPPSWTRELFNTSHHMIVLQAELLFPNKQSPDKRLVLMFERVLFNGTNREQYSQTYHIDYLQPFIHHATRYMYSSGGIRFTIKSFGSLRSFDPKKVYDEDYTANIIGFRMYSLKNPITYYHHLAYKSYKVDELEPYSLQRIRLMNQATTVHLYSDNIEENVDHLIANLDSLSPSNDDITVMAVNMRDRQNMYGVYYLYSQSPVKHKAPHLLRLDTFEQHDELCRLGKKQPTIYITVWFHPYFRKWSLVHRDFNKNIVPAPSNQQGSNEQHSRHNRPTHQQQDRPHERHNRPYQQPRQTNK